MIIYLASLFALARYANQQAKEGKEWFSHPAIYALSLGVYCTSWTFFGLVGTAAEGGWDFLPILIGPIILYVFGFPIIRKIARITREERLDSITDFLSFRYGKRKGIALVVSIVAILATVPYIALQLKAVADAFAMFAGDAAKNIEISMLTAIAMAAFALLFGTQSSGRKVYNAGLVTAVAFESVIKLIAMAAVAALCISLALEDSIPLSSAESVFLDFQPDIGFFVQTLVSACMVLCLPRMFHLCFVENHSESQLEDSRWLFPVYLALMIIFVVVIASVGNFVFSSQSVDISSDSYMIAIPLQEQSFGVGLLAFIGGFSAATAMIIVATIAVSQIVSNNIILPLLLERDKQLGFQRDYSRAMRIIRRSTVIMVIFLAFFYQRTLVNNLALTSIGLIAFALAVQLAPSLIFGLYWGKGNAHGAYAGITVGSLLWFYTLFVPLLSDGGLGFESLLEQGPWGIQLLAPQRIFGLSFTDSYSLGVIVSLLGNIIAYLVFSQLFKARFTDRLQSQRFLYADSYSGEGTTLGDILINDLRTLLNQFLSVEHTEKILLGHDGFADPPLLQTVERSLAGITGVATARSLLESISTHRPVKVEEVMNIVRDTTQALRFNQDVLYASFESVPTGISVVNEKLELVAWNSKYQALFELPDSMLQIGMPIVEIARFNASRGMLGEGDTEELVQTRMRHLRRANPYRVRRSHNKSTVIEIKGEPLPRGGYVTTYDDISEFMRAQNELELAKIDLEARVHERTKTIEEINASLLEEISTRREAEAQLLEAKMEAENANRTKSEFLALASHDIMQPLNAASLFTDSLSNDSSIDSEILAAIRSSIESASSTISTLMEISQIDKGVFKPSISSVSVQDIFDALRSEYAVLAEQSRVIKFVNTRAYVRADKVSLTRILQNFISNAVKYSDSRVLVGCRRRGESLEITVLDQGRGISKKDIEAIFGEFYRANEHKKIEGIGLGLAVTKRLGEAMGGDIRVISHRGKGSAFSITLPISEPIERSERQSEESEHRLNGLRVLCVDDDQRNLNALTGLLKKWGCVIRLAEDNWSAFRAVDGFAPDVLLMDYQLQDDLDGLELSDRLLDQLGPDVGVCILSAADISDLRDQANARGYSFIPKPIKPAKLLAFLSSRVDES